MEAFAKLQKEIGKIEEKIGYTFKEKTHLALAFVHRSYANEHRVVGGHNERLEFLGDAILGLLVSEFLYTHLPTHPEGELSYLRSRLVEAAACSEYLDKLSLSSYLLLGKGEAMNEGKGRKSILADFFEALLGAIYLDGGYHPARHFFFLHCKEEILQIIGQPMRNYKAELQEFLQKKAKTAPLYEVISAEGPDHSKVFHVVVKLEGKELGRGLGSSKKEGEQSAAEAALKKIGEVLP
jgi:ribonuclease III